ncbi:hypothetical protein N7516_006170 [Penicillium verrucosum]|uniref:uncharacterized protein n=1 Tax=Penicillium verrucosum TaxID=60171 RepID=UPI002544D70F|nr:uncharacterized protein N7516_006170 [Penicillium verrucosum]KAJ5931681.1 hypothetical protein N7516_006170 [Penicillium verrucosum]
MQPTSLFCNLCLIYNSICSSVLMDISGVGTAELVVFDGVEKGLELELLVVVDKGDAELLALRVADVDEV